MRKRRKAAWASGVSCAARETCGLRQGRSERRLDQGRGQVRQALQARAGGPDPDLRRYPIPSGPVASTWAPARMAGFQSQAIPKDEACPAPALCAA